MLAAFLLCSALAGPDPVQAWGQELSDMARGLHAGSLGYVDIAQTQTLAPSDAAEHPVLGSLRGFTEYRRASGVVLGPDSAAPVRLGLEGMWEGGGWTPDLYLYTPPGIHLQAQAWSIGMAGGWKAPGLFGAFGVHHADPMSWSGPGGGRVRGPETDLWAFSRLGRAGILAAGDRKGMTAARVSLLSDPSPIRRNGPWFVPQLEAAVDWTRSDWNAWSGRDAWGLALRAPLFEQRLRARLEAGSDGFRTLQIESNVDPQGLVGLDASWSERSGSGLAGFRLRIPLLTFSVNDPDDLSDAGPRGNLIWSIRFCITWEDSQTWYAPGRRPESSGDRS